jgi:hypothetical protein
VSFGAEVGEFERLERLLLPAGLAPRGPVQRAGDAAAAAPDPALVLGVDADRVGSGAEAPTASLRSGSSAVADVRALHQPV